MNSHLHVKRIYLENIRCFDSLEIKLNKKNESIVIVGDNGQGKSTILRSLAMGLCDQSSASALFRELPGEYVRHGAITGVIEVDLSGKGAYSYRITTTIHSLENFERVEQKLFRFHGSRQKTLSQDEFPWDRVFASGYGAGIRVQGVQDYDYYLTVDAVYSLFRYDVLLHNPELIVRRLIDEDRKRNGQSPFALTRLKDLLGSMLDLDKSDRIELTSTGIQICGDWGYTDLGSAGDGYRATITWVLDLLAWWFLKAQQENRFGESGRLSGVVLIDEIEQHLHPKWQRSVVRKVLRAFPDIQLIATTHSPVVASGCEGVAVHRVTDGGETVEHPFGWLAEDVYRMMGLKSSRAKPFETDVVREFVLLDRKKLTGKASRSEIVRWNDLLSRLRQLPDSDPVHIMKRLANIQHKLSKAGHKET